MVTPIVLKAQLDIRHSFFVAGPDFTGILDESGQIVWDADRPAARDGFVYDNGDILITWTDEVVLYNPQKEVIFKYHVADINQELGTAQRLDNGQFLIAELGARPRLLEVDLQAKIAKIINLQPETDNIHMQTRMARKLESGNYLVPHLLAFAVKEYNERGDVVNIFRTDLVQIGGREAENWPFTAIRLPNGNTLINLTHGNKTIEVDKAGVITWMVSNEDFKEKPFNDACGAQRLANGNTVIAAYNAKEGIKLFEVTPDKKLVWTYAGPYRVHHFQILTTNGRMLKAPFFK
jgi:hypothetical protein